MLGHFSMEECVGFLKTIIDDNCVTGGAMLMLGGKNNDFESLFAVNVSDFFLLVKKFDFVSGEATGICFKSRMFFLMCDVISINLSLPKKKSLPWQPNRMDQSQRPMQKHSPIPPLLLKLSKIPTIKFVRNLLTHLTHLSNMFYYPVVLRRGTGCFSTIWWVKCT